MHTPVLNGIEKGKLQCLLYIKGDLISSALFSYDVINRRKTPVCRAEYL